MKTVSELIAELQKVDGNLPVYINADHGQTNIQWRGVETLHVESLEYYAEPAWDEDGEEQDKSKPLVCVVYD